MATLIRIKRLSLEGVNGNKLDQQHYGLADWYIRNSASACFSVYCVCLGQTVLASEFRFYYPALFRLLLPH